MLPLLLLRLHAQIAASPSWAGNCISRNLRCGKSQSSTRSAESARTFYQAFSVNNVSFRPVGLIPACNSEKCVLEFILQFHVWVVKIVVKQSSPLRPYEMLKQR